MTSRITHRPLQRAVKYAAHVKEDRRYGPACQDCGALAEYPDRRCLACFYAALGLPLHTPSPDAPKGIGGRRRKVLAALAEPV